VTPDICYEHGHYRAVLMLNGRIIYTARGMTADAARAACMDGYQNARSGRFGVLDWKPTKRQPRMQTKPEYQR